VPPNNPVVPVPQLDVVGDAKNPTAVAPVPTTQEPVVADIPEDDESTVVAPVPVVLEVEPVVPPRTCRRDEGKNKKYFGDEWVNYQTGSSSTGSTQKILASVLDRQFIQSLDWKRTLEQIKSKDWAYFIGKMDVYFDYDDNAVVCVHPHLLATKANPEDIPTWEMAMNGPDHAGYWKAMEVASVFQTGVCENCKRDYALEVINRWRELTSSTPMHLL
jgi:hypothetical protein